MFREQFDRKITNKIKGIMIIFMFILHFFTMPGEYVNGISYPQFAKVSSFWNHSFAICVPVFAFLTGYFYYYCKCKNYRYAFKKIRDILIPYWTVYSILLIIGLFTNTYVYGGIEIILELFALYRPVMWFCWYVSFYIISMLVLPITAKMSNNFLIAIMSGMVLPYGLGICLNHFINLPMIIGRVIADFSTYYPVISLGYICSKFSIFDKLDQYIFRKKRNIGTGIFSGVMLILIFTCQYYITNDIVNNFWSGYIFLWLYFFSILLFVFFLVIQMNCWKSANNKLCILEELGKKSMYMWFVHCIFFNCSKRIFQPILYCPKNPFIVLIWGLGLCYCVASILEMLCKNKILKLID